MRREGRRRALEKTTMVTTHDCQFTHYVLATNSSLPCNQYNEGVEAPVFAKLQFCGEGVVGEAKHAFFLANIGSMGALSGATALCVWRMLCTGDIVTSFCLLSTYISTTMIMYREGMQAR